MAGQAIEFVAGQTGPKLDRDGRTLKWLTSRIDFDRCKRAEEQLETIPSMVWSASPTGEVTHINQRVLEYSGLSLLEFLNLGWKRFIHPDDFEDTAKAFFHAIQTGEPYNATHRLRRRDGEYRWHHASGQPLRDSDGKIVQWYGLSFDIDEQKRAEDQLRDTRTKLAQASRFAMVAELAASIAHELNQPLMAILGNAQAAKRWLQSDSKSGTEVESSIDQVIRAAQVAGETMQHIRALFKQESFAKEDVRLQDVLHEIVRVVREDPTKRHVSITCNFEESLPLISVDRIQFQQVFINLIGNAIDAFDGQQAAPVILLRAATDGSKMLVQVIDNGRGVDDPDRIFDAFMTTKEKGMGIGLAVSRTIVEAHGGQIWAENNKTAGATFNVTIPLTRADSPAA